MRRLYTNTMPFYVRDFIHGFWYLLGGRVLEPVPLGYKRDDYIFPQCLSRGGGGYLGLNLSRIFKETDGKLLLVTVLCFSEL